MAALSIPDPCPRRVGRDPRLKALAVWCAGYFLWENRTLLKLAQRDADAGGANSVPKIFTHFVTLLLFIAITVCFLAVQSGIYFLTIFLLK